MTTFAANLSRLTDYLSQDFLGGPKVLKLNWVVNFQKGATAFWVIFLMMTYENYSTQAWVYLALHGSYGFCWLLKDVVFPDPKWQVRITFGGAFIAVAMVLGPYWLIPYLLISPILGEAHTGANWVGMCAAIALHTLGIAIMMTADAQKYFTLKYQRGLIRSGMFKYVRHPNYLGEMMIYGSYAIVAAHWIPWVILAWVWLGLFAVNIAMKEKSMSRYDEWAAYKKKSWYLVPGIF
jgi:protein-S-isoprenylcysteine O-methyltransferase Ste14